MLTQEFAPLQVGEESSLIANSGFRKALVGVQPTQGAGGTNQAVAVFNPLLADIFCWVTAYPKYGR